jgi:hypothetical protein
MASKTPILGIDELETAQSQPEVPVNAAMRTLEAMGQLIVVSRVAVAPPGSPTDGDCYIPAASATGAWTGHDLEIAINQNGTWVFVTPKKGFIAYVTNEDLYYKYGGSSWETWP